MPLAHFHKDTLTQPKALCNLDHFTCVSEDVQLLVSNPEIVTIFTDGSVELHTGRAGSACICGDYTYTRRISNNSSILQAELFAIKGAFTHALRLPQDSIYILTDSLSAIHSLQKRPPDDNTQLITLALFKIQQLSDQGKSIHFQWIPSHARISQNDLADLAAKDSLRHSHVTTVTSRN